MKINNWILLPASPRGGGHSFLTSRCFLEGKQVGVFQEQKPRASLKEVLH